MQCIKLHRRVNKDQVKNKAQLGKHWAPKYLSGRFPVAKVKST